LIKRIKFEVASFSRYERSKGHALNF